MLVLQAVLGELPLDRLDLSGELVPLPLPLPRRRLQVHLPRSQLVLPATARRLLLLLLPRHEPLQLAHDLLAACLDPLQRRWLHCRPQCHSDLFQRALRALPLFSALPRRHLVFVLRRLHHLAHLRHLRLRRAALEALVEALDLLRHPVGQDVELRLTPPANLRHLRVQLPPLPVTRCLQCRNLRRRRAQLAAELRLGGTKLALHLLDAVLHRLHHHIVRRRLPARLVHHCPQRRLRGHMLLVEELDCALERALHKVGVEAFESRRDVARVGGHLLADCRHLVLVQLLEPRQLELEVGNLLRCLLLLCDERVQHGRHLRRTQTRTSRASEGVAPASTRPRQQSVERAARVTDRTATLELPEPT